MTMDDRTGGIVVDFRPMSPDEIERTMQFLLHQQARFAADFERLSGKTDRIADGLIGLTGIVGHLTSHLEDVTEHFSHVTDRLGDVTDRVGELTDRLGEVTDTVGKVTDRLDDVTDRLAAAQERTDHQIRSLQELFERHLRDDHGYGPS